MNLIQKYGKKKVIIASSILIATVSIIGIGTWYMMEENHKKEVLNSIDIIFVDEAIVEYGAKDVDFTAFIKDKIGEPEVILPTEEIDTMLLTEKIVTFKLSQDGYSKNAELKINVKDTQFPIIEFLEERVSIELDSDFSIESNIKSVSDSIDGSITITDNKELEKDGYYILGEVKTDESGEYNIKIVAIDKNGNKSEKEFAVVVNEKEVTQNSTLTPPPSTGNTNQLPQNKVPPVIVPPITTPIENKTVCPNGREPKNANLPCDAVISGAWEQADPIIQFDDYDSAYAHGDYLMMNDIPYMKKYDMFSIAPCGRNDGSQFYVITPSR